MNNLKQYLPILLLSLISSSCTTTDNTSNEKDTKDTSKAATGFIKVREGDGVRECSIPATPGDHHVKDYGCTNDQAYHVRFVEVPSALHITFFDNSVHGWCENNSNSWEIEVRTVKNPTTTPADDYISIAGMYGTPDNTLVAPGVLKIRVRDADGGPINGRLTCVRVEEGK
jgi:hypothetical protein